MPFFVSATSNLIYSPVIEYKKAIKGDIMGGTYLCIFGLIFLGLLGAANSLLLLKEFIFCPKREIKITLDDPEKTEYIVRTALIRGGRLTLIADDKILSDNESLEILSGLYGEKNIVIERKGR